MELQQQVEEIAALGGGVYGISAKNLDTGETVDVRADEVFSTASVIKVGIMVELFRQVDWGKLSLHDRMELTEEYRVGGSGLFKEFNAGLQPALRDVCVAMIVVSDNTATNMLATKLGLDAINEGLQALGLRQTRLHRLITFGAVPEGAPPQLGLTTPNEMRRLFEGIACGKVLSPRASQDMLAILARQQDRRMIPRLLPGDYDAVTGEGDPFIAHKTGSVNGVRNDVGYVACRHGPRWVLSVFSSDLDDLRWTVENAGEVTIGRISRAIYDSWA